MTKAAKAWLITGIVLIVTGSIIFGGVMMALNFDFKKLSTVKYETNEHIITEAYSDIRIDTDTADIVFVPADSTGTYVTCYEETNAVHTVSVTDGVLVINNDNNKKWYDHIGISFDNPKITVSLPAGQYGDVTVKTDTGKVNLPEELGFKNIDICVSTGDVTDRASATGSINIKTSTGKINLENISADTLDLKASTGKVSVNSASVTGGVTVTVTTGKSYLSDVSCNKLTSSGNTGDITLKNVIAETDFDIKRTTGDVSLDGCDAAELKIETDTGAVNGTLLTDKIFITNTSTGSVKVPKTKNGGICEIRTSTGNVKIDIVKRED